MSKKKTKPGRGKSRKVYTSKELLTSRHLSGRIFSDFREKLKKTGLVWNQIQGALFLKTISYAFHMGESLIQIRDEQGAEWCDCCHHFAWPEDEGEGDNVIQYDILMVLITGSVSRVEAEFDDAIDSCVNSEDVCELHDDQLAGIAPTFLCSKCQDKLAGNWVELDPTAELIGSDTVRRTRKRRS